MASQEQTIVIKRVIRPTVYQAQARQQSGHFTLTIIHPAEGDAYEYSLDEPTRQRLVQELAAGKVLPATADQIPKWEGSA